MDRSVVADISWLSQRLPVLVLSATEVTSEAVAAVRNGARGVVFKRFAVEVLMDAIRTVAAGNVWLPPTLQTQVAAQLRGPSANRLTPREEEIVHCVARGQRNAEVAKNLSISEETVKTHLTRIFRKVGVRDRIELVLYAARVGVSAESGIPPKGDGTSPIR
jgi:DNA-binding NarL/FixJ family response regulator